jgi:hypothetical protein
MARNFERLVAFSLVLASTMPYIVGSATRAEAQTTTGTVSGTITDSGGLPLAGVGVTLMGSGVSFISELVSDHIRKRADRPVGV